MSLVVFESFCEKIHNHYQKYIFTLQPKGNEYVFVQTMTIGGERKVTGLSILF